VIKTQIAGMYADLVAEVDPKGRIMDKMLQQKVVTLEQHDSILTETTRHADYLTAICI